MLEKYTQDIEDKMKLFFLNLSEKDKRHYAALEAIKLDYGGIQYLASLFGYSRQTISQGIQELKSHPLASPKDKVRRSGGGRKCSQERYPNIDEVFLK